MAERRILVLYGSPHTDGYTAKLLDAFRRAFPEKAEWIVFNPYQEKTLPCFGCGYCEGHNGCAYQDLDSFDELLHTCDLMVVASPVYNLSFPAPLKAVLDRTQRYFSARFVRGERPPIPKHKKAAMLLTCGADTSEGADIMRKQLQMIFTVLNTKLVSEVVWQNTDRDKNMHKLEKEIHLAAKKLAIE